MIQEGHINAYTYRYHFFMIAVKAIAEKRKERIVDMAKAFRMEISELNKLIDAKTMSHDEIYEKYKADEL